jgi:hypothetical protein
MKPVFIQWPLSQNERGAVKVLKMSLSKLCNKIRGAPMRDELKDRKTGTGF